MNKQNRNRLIGRENRLMLKSHYHYHSKSIVYIRVHSGYSKTGFCWTMGFHKCVMMGIPQCSIIQNNFIALKILCAPTIHPSSLATSDLTFSTVLPFAECVIELKMCICVEPFLFGFFHLVTYIWVSTMSFHSLIVHFFLVLNNMPLSGCITVYSPSRLLKDILVAPRFYQLLMQLLYTSLCGFCVDRVFNSSE